MSSSFLDLYLKRTPGSRSLYERASQTLPGGVGGQGKFFKPYPPYLTRGVGAHVTDVDGNEYLDIMMGEGVHLLGHSPTAVHKAVKAQIDHGTHLVAPTLLEVELGEKMIAHVPWIERLRFCNTGSEATQMAIRVARAFTGRPQLAKFEGNFHGQHDEVLVSAMHVRGPEDAPAPARDCAGLLAGLEADLLVLPYNNTEATLRLIESRASQLCAVIIEPISGFGNGLIPADKEFLSSLRGITAEHAIPLIFDEVITGFRVGFGGAAEYFGIEPDLAAFGKVIGGGFPIGAYGGKANIMEQALPPETEEFDLKDYAFQSGTYTGNSISMRAGLSVFEALEDGTAYRHLDEIGEKARGGLREIASKAGLDLQVTGLASMFNVIFAKDTPRNFRELANSDPAQTTDFAWGLLANDVFAVPGYPAFLGVAHTQADVDHFLAVAEQVLTEMARNKDT
jgi:glutamate-1-semialdehyde 2,1-aminomutase